MTILQTALLYLGVGGLVTFCASMGSRTKNKAWVLVIVLILSCLAGFRSYDVGTDTARYLDGIAYFFLTGTTSWDCVFSEGYGHFSSIVLTIYNDSTFFLVVQALLTNWLFVRRLWDFNGPCSFGMMVFIFYFTIFPYTLCLMCQLFSVSIVFFFSRYIGGAKTILFLVGVALAVLIHNSGIVALLYLLPSMFPRQNDSRAKALKKILYMLIFVVDLFAVMFYLLDRYSGYISDRDYASTIGFMIPFQLLSTAVLMMFYGKHPFSKDYRGLTESSYFATKWATVFYFLGLLFSAASYIVANAGRISYAFLPFGAVLYGFMAKQTSGTTNGILCNLACGIYILLYATYSFYIADGMIIWPYNFVF